MFRKNTIKTELINEARGKINIIDVRELAEIKASGSIKGSLKIPMSSIKENLDKLDKNKTYHIMCHSGSRSMQVAKFLDKHGYSVVNLMGGFSAYKGRTDYEL